MSVVPTLPVQRFAARTLPAVLAHTSNRLPDKVFLRFFRPGIGDAAPREVTFRQFADAVGRAAVFLRGCGVGPGDRVLLLAENSPEWQFVALGAQLLRAEPAALFASLGAGPAQAIARRVRPTVVFVSGAAQWTKLEPIAHELAGLGLRAVLSEEALEVASIPAELKWRPLDVVTGDAAEPLAPGELARLAGEVGEEDPFLLLFTSGTTGRQKGIRLPQRSIVHACENGTVATGTSEQDVGLHLLPFGHVAGQDQFHLALGQGHTLLMIARRDELDRALAAAPTYLFSVPMVYERIRDGVEAKLSKLPGPLGAFARTALDASARVRVDGSTRMKDRLLTDAADLLVGRALRRRLGGAVRGVFSGGAPASTELFRSFEGLGIPFVELYGMTETAGMISSNLFGGRRVAGSAGWISGEHEVRIADDGELQLRGPLMFSGFLEAEDAADAYTADGFFRTGDLARFDAEGMLRVEGRKKHLLVLSTGKKVSPEPIENTLAAHAPFKGAVLVGDHRSFVSAIVFVAREALEKLTRDGEDPATALLPQAHAALHGTSEYERPKRLLVVPGEPTEYPDLVTPTLKIRRDAVLRWQGQGITALYARSA